MRIIFYLTSIVLLASLEDFVELSSKGGFRQVLRG